VDPEALDYSRYFWQGERVRLRPLRLEDAELHYAASLDSPARQMLEAGIELPSSVAHQRESLGRYVDCKDVDGMVLFTIETLDGLNVGGISLHSRDQKNGTFSFGVVIGRAYRGRGYAHDAARILLRYGFHEQRCQKCHSACLEGNEGSIALHHALGFVDEGRRRRQVYMNGRYYDELLWGLTREEFDAAVGR
jgi:RimJ/RimL family protein N-acetyltransferase